jgi:homoserine kinase
MSGESQAQSRGSSPKEVAFAFAVPEQPLSTEEARQVLPANIRARTL